MKLADALMAPTRIYVKPVLELLASTTSTPWPTSPAARWSKKSSAWYPKALGLDIDGHRDPYAAGVRLAAARRRSGAEEMWRTFNCGIGFVLIVAPADAAAVESDLDRLGLAHRKIGAVVAADGGERVRIA